MTRNKSLRIIFFILPIFIFSFFSLKAQANTGTILTGNQTSYLCSNTACTTGSRIVWETSDGTAVSITDSALTGDIWGKDVGWIRLNPNGNTGVTMTPAKSGILAGYAWGQNTGWINFNPDYGGVTIDPSTGKFSGWAWAQNYGWIKFQCPGANTCVETNWRPTVNPPSGGGNPVCTPGIDCFCDLYPSNPSCISQTFCQLHPSDPSCVTPPFCQTHPTDPSCVTPPFCQTHPTDPSCITPTFCQLHPTDPSCITLPPPPPPPPDILEEIIGTVDDISSVIGKINAPIRDFIEKTFYPVTVEKIDKGLKIAAIASVLFGGVLSIATALFLNPLATPELILIPFRLWALLLTALGLKKRIKPWGTVYDSVTKQPLDPVYVSLFNLEGEEIVSSITDIDGRYGFFVEPGVYKVVPKKTNYIFPSHALANNFKDELYQDLYFGDYLNISAGEVFVKNIPMDPINFDWNEFAKNKKQLLKYYSKKELMLGRISNWLFGFGFTVATVALVVSPEKYNIVIFGLYVLMFILRRTSFKLRAKGRVVGSDGLPLSFAFVRIFSIETNVEISHKVTDKMGRYHMLVPNGIYYVKIEKKNDDGTYSLVHTSNYVKIVHGTLNKVFNI